MSRVFTSSGSIRVKSAQTELKLVGNTTETGTLELHELSTNGQNKVSISAPDSLTADYSLILPANDGDADQVLTTDGSGTLTWEDGGGGGDGDITGVTAGVGLSGGGASGGVTLTVDISEFSDVTPANGDKLLTLDSDGSTEQLTTVAGLATLFAGDGLTASSSVMAITAAQTTITSISNAGLKIGRDAHNLIDFATTDDEVIFRIANVDEIKMVANALVPVTSDGAALGTASLMWQDLFLASGAVINFNNGDVTLTHTSNTLTVAGGNLAATISTATQGTIDHDSLANFVANEHIDHTSVSVIAGDGLTGGGTIAANRTFAVGAGTGIDVAADAISVDVSDFMANGANNRIVTSTGTDAMNAEENLTFDGSALSLTGTLTVGVNDTGHDVKIFGATTGAYMLWDESEDDLIIKKGRILVQNNSGDSKFIANTNGNVTVTDLTVSGGDINYENGQDATLSIDATTSTTAGRDLTISAGSTATGSANINGGDLHIKSGGGDGTGTSIMTFSTKVSGTDTAAERMKINTDGDLEIGNDIKLNSDSSIINFGANDEITLTHVHDVGLTLTNTISGTDNRPVVFQLKSEENAIAVNDVIGSLEFAAGDSDGSDGATVAAGIHAIAENTFTGTANPTKLVFTTGVSETAAASATAKMTLSSGGNLTTVGNILPSSSDGGTLGSASLMWSDLFLASGGVVQFHDGTGEATITHSANTIAITSGYGSEVCALTVSGDITAFSSDKRLKKNIEIIENPLQKIDKLSGFIYDWDLNKCVEVGFKPKDEKQIGVFAQDVKEVIPEAVKPAPFDTKDGISISGDNYLTVQYEKIVPLLIESIKEQQKQIDELRNEIEILKN